MGRTGWLAFSVLLAACVPGPPSGDTGSDAELDASTWDAPTVVRRPLNLIVLRFVEADISVPAEGAVVALDQAGLPRRELITDDRGWVNFDNIDWSVPVDVTVSLAGHLLTSRLGWTEAEFREDVVFTRPAIRLTPLFSPGIAISGTVTGMTDVTRNWLAVSAIGPNTDYYSDRGPDYLLYTWPSLDFGLVAYEYFFDELTPNRLRQTISHWAVMPVHAPTGDERIDIDFAAHGVSPTVVRASFMLPDHPFFADPRSVFVDETDSTGSALFGTPSSLDVGIDGRVTYTLESIDFAGAPPGYTQIIIAGTSASSIAMVEGRALTGPLPAELLVPPAFAEIGPIPRGGPVPITNAAPSAFTGMRLFDSEGTTWVLLGGRGAEALSIPALPTGADPALVFPVGVRVAPTLCGNRALPLGTCHLYAGGDDRPVAP